MLKNGNDFKVKFESENELIDTYNEILEGMKS